MSKKKATKKVTQKQADKMIESGEAQIPTEAIVSKSSFSVTDYEMHPKFSKFKTAGET
jgi:hypothetical protein